MLIHSSALATKPNMRSKYTNTQPHTNTSIHLHKHKHTHTWDDYYKLPTTFPVNHVKRWSTVHVIYLHANSK